MCLVTPGPGGTTLSRQGMVGRGLLDAVIVLGYARAWRNNVVRQALTGRGLLDPVIVLGYARAWRNNFVAAGYGEATGGWWAAIPA